MPYSGKTRRRDWLATVRARESPILPEDLVNLPPPPAALAAGWIDATSPYMRRALLCTGTCVVLLGLALVPQVPAMTADLAQPTAAIQQSWANGGSLHDATVAEWLAATESNQLATSADWALAFPSVKVALEMRKDPEELRGFADRLKRCVSGAAAMEYRPAEPPRTSEIAARCAVALEWV